MGNSTDFDAIPIISMAPWTGGDPEERAKAADEVQRVCHEIGFFLLVDHGIPDAFVDRVFAMMHELFGLPLEQKLLIDKKRSPHFRGWEPVGAEFTNNRPDVREQVDLWTEHPPRPPELEPLYQRLLGPNQWLPEDVLPGYRDLCDEWFTRMGGVATEVLGMLSLGLGLGEHHLDTLFGDEEMSLTKFIRYPPTPDGAAGVNAHRDAAFLTVLCPGPTPGLQVQNHAGDWIPVPSVPGSFVINLGEMLQGITGNYLVATPHRVVTDEERYSAAYFHGPSLDTPLDLLPLDPRFAEAVAASPYHATAGFMGRRQENEAGVADMASSYKAATYGEQLWNYFCRSYPENVRAHYGT